MKHISLLFVLLLVLTSCSSEPEIIVVTATPEPTNTPVPATPTLEITTTPEPTHTPEKTIHDRIYEAILKAERPGWLEIGSPKAIAPEKYSINPKAKIVLDARFLKEGDTRGGVTVFVYENSEDATARFESIIDGYGEDAYLGENSAIVGFCFFGECFVSEVVLAVDVLVVDVSLSGEDLDDTMEVATDYLLSVVSGIVEVLRYGVP